MRTSLVLFGLVSLASWTLAPPARADGAQQSTVTSTPDANVHIQVLRGNVSVVGWSKREVGVRTTTGDVSVTTTDGGSEVTVHAARDPEAAIEVSVPAGASVEVRTVEAPITVRGVTGHVQAQTVEGDIDVSGGATDVEARNVSGHVRLALGRADVRVSSVDGTVEVKLPGGGTAALRNVSGGTRVEGAHLTRLEARSVAGDVDLVVDLTGSGPFVARTHSGALHVVLPKNASTTVDAHSFRGEVKGVDAGAPSPPDGGRSELSLYTFAGTIDVTRK